MLRNQRLAQLDVLVVSLLLGCAGVNDLLPLVVLGLALCLCQPDSKASSDVFSDQKEFVVVEIERDVQSNRTCPAS
jgi:hypothetical protein